MPANLTDCLPPPGEVIDPDTALERFLGWLIDIDLEPYPAQEEAFLEIFDGRHVVLNTPTGSGKSLVALAMHFLALCTGKRAFYTSPIKALVSEKFFSLCEALGAERVGMMTGDAAINRDASVICCTAEVLSNMALQQGRAAPVDYVVMDEFHYYSDRDRGVAWQIPLITMPDATFLLMSATLGDVSDLIEDLEDRTGDEVAWVRSGDRPVPLDFLYNERPIQETIERLIANREDPVYVVHFTQRDASELAQALTSISVCSKEEKLAIRKEIGGFRFDSPFGATIKRCISAGIGLHHAGLLPKYRLLVEKLSQKGLLKVICGTDTLGVGINVPIRSVLFTRLCKFDGERVGILSVRDFKQISGRAGRKGYDDHGYVVSQAPAHVIENKRLAAKSDNKASKKKFVKRKPPTRGYTHWDEDTFRRLIKDQPEEMSSQFGVTHGMMLQLLQRDNAETPAGEGYRALVDLIAASHEHAGSKRRLRRRAKQMFRALLDAEIVELVPHPGGGRHVMVHEAFRDGFALFHPLSLYALDVLDSLDPESEDYALDVLSVIEAILEHPRVVIRSQEDTLKTELVNRLKGEGVEYDQRMEALEKVTYPKPRAQFFYDSFEQFADKYPWVAQDHIRPKSVARDMYEKYMSFAEFAKHYGLSRSEGVLLRYLSQTYKTLIQTVPQGYYTEELVDLSAWLRATLERVDSSLHSEWEALQRPAEEQAEVVVAPDISRDSRSFQARIRVEMHALVRSLSRQDYEEAAGGLCHDEDAWSADRLQDTMAPFHGLYGNLLFNHEARFPKRTVVTKTGGHQWTVQQLLLDENDESGWVLRAEVDLREDHAPQGPIVRLREIDD